MLLLRCLPSHIQAWLSAVLLCPIHTTVCRCVRPGMSVGSFGPSGRGGYAGLGRVGDDGKLESRLAATVVPLGGLLLVCDGGGGPGRWRLWVRHSTCGCCPQERLRTRDNIGAVLFHSCLGACEGAVLCVSCFARPGPWEGRAMFMLGVWLAAVKLTTTFPVSLDD